LQFIADVDEFRRPRRQQGLIVRASVCQSDVGSEQRLT
jgi:hypothetical protein